MSTAPKETQQRSPLRLWLPLGGMVVVLLVGSCVVLWQGLPRWAPQWTMDNSPFVEPAVRALASQRTEPLGIKGPNDDFDLVVFPDGGPAFESLLRDPLPLRPLLGDSDPAIRREAAHLAALAYASNDPASAQLLRACVQSDDAVVRAWGLVGFAQLPDPIRPALGVLLNDPEPRIRGYLMELLADEGGTRAADDLLLLGLESPLEDVRLACSELVVDNSLDSIDDAEFAAEGMPKLLALLDSKDREVVQAAGDVLAMRVPNANGVDAALVIPLVAHPDTIVRVGMLYALADVWSLEDLPSVLAPLLSGADPRARFGALRLLANEVDGVDTSPLARATGHPDPGVRAMAIDWEAASSDEGLPREVLLEALRSEHACVREAAARSGRQRQVDDVEPFAALADDPDAWVRRAVTHSLCAAESERAATLLAKLSADDDSEVRLAAFDGMGRFPFAVTREAIAKGFADPVDDVQEEALRAALVNRHEDLLAPLLQAMPGMSDYRVRDAVKVLAAIGSRAATDAILPYLDHFDPGVRWDAAQCVGKAGRRDQIKRLVEMAKYDTSSLARVGALMGLEKLGAEQFLPLVYSFTLGDAELKLNAIAFLRDVHPPNAKEAQGLELTLMRLSGDRDPAVAKAAQQELKRRAKPPR